MNLVFVIAMNAALACGDAKASVEFDVPASVLTINDGTELLRELSGVLLKDGKITLDAKNGLIRGTQQALGDYRVSLNMDRRQLVLLCGAATGYHRSHDEASRAGTPLRIKLGADLSLRTRSFCGDSDASNGVTLKS